MNRRKAALGELVRGYGRQISASHSLADAICGLIERIEERRPFTDSELAELRADYLDLKGAMKGHPATTARLAELAKALGL